jgi:hypothetical protein
MLFSCRTRGLKLWNAIRVRGSSQRITRHSLVPLLVETPSWRGWEWRICGGVGAGMRYSGNRGNVQNVSFYYDQVGCNLSQSSKMQNTFLSIKPVNYIIRLHKSEDVLFLCPNHPGIYLKSLLQKPIKHYNLQQTISTTFSTLQHPTRVTEGEHLPNCAQHSVARL